MMSGFCLGSGKCLFERLSGRLLKAKDGSCLKSGGWGALSRFPFGLFGEHRKVCSSGEVEAFWLVGYIAGCRGGNIWL